MNNLPWRLIFLIAALVLLCFYGFEVIPEDQTVFLGVGLALGFASIGPWSVR